MYLTYMSSTALTIPEYPRIPGIFLGYSWFLGYSEISLVWVTNYKVLILYLEQSQGLLGIEECYIGSEVSGAVLYRVRSFLY